LNASVNPNGVAATVLFMYGTNASYSVTNVFSIGSGTSAVPVSSVLTNLLLGVYHYQVAATNIYGATFGGDLTFTNVVGSQTIAFTAPTNCTYGDSQNLSANASTGLPVTFSLVSGPSVVSNNIVTAIGAGLITVQASQAGNAYYAPASTNQSFYADKALLTLSADSASRAYGAVTNLTGTITGVVNGDDLTLTNVGCALTNPAFSLKFEAAVQATDSSAARSPSPSMGTIMFSSATPSTAAWRNLMPTERS